MMNSLESWNEKYEKRKKSLHANERQYVPEWAFDLAQAMKEELEIERRRWNSMIESDRSGPDE